MAIAATDNADTNHEVAAAGRALRIPVNVVDHPEDGSFIMPSIIDRSPVIAAVSTGGASPVLARLIRTRLESLIPAGYGRLAELAGQFRDHVKDTLSESRGSAPLLGPGVCRAALPNGSSPGTCRRPRC